MQALRPEWPFLFVPPQLLLLTLAGIDATGIEMAPVRDAAPVQSLYFVGWIALGSFCLLNLFVGVLVSTFTEIRAKEEGAHYMSESQQQWADATRQVR